LEKLLVKERDWGDILERGRREFFQENLERESEVKMKEKWPLWP
jgi:hypothetical protein